MLVSYLYPFKFTKIRFQIHETDPSDIHIPEYDWGNSMYETQDAGIS